MKFVYPYFDDVISFGEGFVYSIVAENQKVMRELVEDIASQAAGNNGECVLSISNKPCPINKNAELLTDFAPFDINQKTLISTIVSKLETQAVGEDHFSETSALLCKIENYVDDIAFDLDCEIKFTKLTVSSLLKACGLSIKDDYNNSLEKLIDYMDMVCRFEKEKLFVTVNMRSFFTDKEMNDFAETAVSHKFKILMLESVERTKLPYEKRLLIDDDMCII